MERIFATASLVGVVSFIVWAGTGYPEPFRVANFSAGPGAMPWEVLKQAEADFVDYKGSGMAIFEMSHRDAGGPVQTMMQDAAAATRRLLRVPDNYHVLYMHGGAHLQFSALPFVLGKGHTTAEYVVTGYWSGRARDEGSKTIKVRTVEGVATQADGRMALKTPEQWNVDPSSAYVHICAGETIDGVEFLEDPVLPPGVEHVPIIADFTSTLFSRAVNVSRYGAIYASAGKNLGPSGVAMVIVRDDLLGRQRLDTPSIFSWSIAANTKPIPSLYNTPPTLPLWMHSLMLNHMENMGGMAVVQLRAKARAARVYGMADRYAMYHAPVARSARAVNNVPLRIVDGSSSPRLDLEKQFVKEAAEAGMVQLFGHASRGGIRVTLYIGVADAWVDRVVAFMEEFAERTQPTL